jgi:hypothetical protein
MSLLPLIPKAKRDQLLKDRRRQLAAFEKIRAALQNKVTKCARKEISDESFYQYLKHTWDKKSRFQGKGWERTGRKSNFSALCVGLKSVLDAVDTDRDRVVVNVIDDLAKRSVPTRGALFSELLCQFFPEQYPVLDKPVRWLTEVTKLCWPHGMTEGARYNYLAQTLRSALSQAPNYPARNLAELDVLIWQKHHLETGQS